jgi:hypothetical protein
MAEPRTAFALEAIDAEICDVEIDVPSDSDALTGLTVAFSVGARPHDTETVTVSGATVAVMPDGSVALSAVVVSVTVPVPALHVVDAVNVNGCTAMIAVVPFRVTEPLAVALTTSCHP